MYESFFGLAHPPFSLTPDPRFLWMSDTHKEGLAVFVSIEYVVTIKASCQLTSGFVFRRQAFRFASRERTPQPAPFAQFGTGFLTEFEK